jgi:hypothetical protein
VPLAFPPHAPEAEVPQRGRDRSPRRGQESDSEEKAGEAIHGNQLLPISASIPSGVRRHHRGHGGRQTLFAHLPGAIR